MKRNIKSDFSTIGLPRLPHGYESLVLMNEFLHYDMGRQCIGKTCYADACRSHTTAGGLVARETSSGYMDWSVASSATKSIGAWIPPASVTTLTLELVSLAGT